MRFLAICSNRVILKDKYISPSRRRTKRRRTGGRTEIITRMPVRDIPTYELLDADGIDAVHAVSMDIVEGIGIEFRDQDAIALWRKDRMSGRGKMV